MERVCSVPLCFLSPPPLLPEPFSQVSAIVPLSFTGWYLCFVHLGSRYMWLRRAPFVTRVFECMVVYNAHQTVLNLCCAIALIQAQTPLQKNNSL